ncbi:hypothetical protein ACF064_01495 [Streptomyces sp. NPDC015492]|uniref:hypothetical protein n=1 Tax=Streptomyces sp. NPDC015492 TaxID=3364958 RepID=UPI0036FE307A
MAVIAAAAAYAAGRVQARGARLGPVDAVRRQHQRDAYARFATAARAFADHTSPSASHVIRAAGEDPSALTRDQRITRAAAIRRVVERSELNAAYVMLALEGPPKIADLAAAITQAAVDVTVAVRAAPATTPDPAHDPLYLHTVLMTTIQAFMEGASAHLNGERRPRPRSLGMAISYDD